jgi:hypothetical protein
MIKIVDWNKSFLIECLTHFVAEKVSGEENTKAVRLDSETHLVWFEVETGYGK